MERALEVYEAGVVVRGIEVPAGESIDTTKRRRDRSVSCRE